MPSAAGAIVPDFAGSNEMTQMAVGCFTIVPLTAVAMALTSGREHPYDFPFWVLPILWIFATMHLWFLRNLLLMVGPFIIMARMGVEFRTPKVWLLVIPISVVAALLMQEPVFGADSMQSILPKPATLVFYFFGAFFYQQGVAVRRWWTVALLPSAVTFCIGFLLLRSMRLRPSPSLTANCPNTCDVQQLADGGERPGGNGFCLADVLRHDGIVRWLLASPRFTVRYLSDASYWIYLAHLPLVVVAHWVFVDWPISYHLKYILTCVSVTGILLIAYQLFIRYTFIGNVLNGPRTRRQRTDRPTAPASA